MKVIFSHGKESGPWGSKIKHLADIAKQYGCNIESIDYTDIMNPDLRVERLLSVLQRESEDFVLVGSSMGGYVSIAASNSICVKGVFLLAPALYMPGYHIQKYNTDQSNIAIIHGWSDDIIPPEHSIKFAKRANCSLHLIDGDHRLNGSIDTVGSLFEQYICALM